LPSQRVLGETLPKILLSDTSAFADKLNFTADLINPWMVRKALLYIKAGDEDITVTLTVMKPRSKTQLFRTEIRTLT
jgi:hypothetical protein